MQRVVYSDMKTESKKCRFTCDVAQVSVFCIVLVPFSHSTLKLTCHSRTCELGSSHFLFSLSKDRPFSRFFCHRARRNVYFYLR